MKNMAGETLGILLFTALQIFGAGTRVLAEEAPATRTDTITTTVEVVRDIRRILPHAEINAEAYLTTYPVLEVVVVPDQPHNFVVAINGTSYQAGANMFRVVEGNCNVVVTRIGKEPCKAMLKVTKSGPNEIDCQM